MVNADNIEAGGLLGRRPVPGVLRPALKSIKNFTFEYLYLIVVVVIAVFIRFWDLGAESLRLDETQSIWQASHSITFIKDYMLKNVHLPLHNSLLHYWMRYFGSSTESVRLLALIPGVLAIPAIYALSSEIIGKERSRLTILLAALSPLWVWYSREIRMYTLLILITTLSYLFFIRILKYNRFKDYVLFTLINVVGIYTHYFFFLVLGVQVIYFLFVSGQINKSAEFVKVNIWLRFLYLFLCAEVLLVIYYPWLKSLFSNYGSGTYAPVFGKPIPFNILLSYFEFTSGYLPDGLTSLVISAWPIAIILGFVFFTKRQNPFTYKLMLAIMGALIPVFVGYFVSVIFKPVYLTRYFVTVTPMLYILIAWYMAELKGSAKYIFALLFMGWVMTALYIQETSPLNPALENYAEAVDFIESNATPRDIIFLSPAYTLYPFQYYYDHGQAKVLTLPIWDKRKGAVPAATEERIKNDIESVREGHKKFYLMVTSNLTDGETPKLYMDMNFTKLEKRQFSKFITVHVYQAEYR